MECNYYQIPKIAKFLQPSEWVLFTIMFDEWKMMKNESGWFFRSEKQLCQDTGLSKSTIQRTIASLVKKGVILTTYYNDGVKMATYNKANEYKINMEKVKELTEKGVKMTTFNNKEGYQNEYEKGVKMNIEGCQNDAPSNNKETKEIITKEKINKKEIEDYIDQCHYGNTEHEVNEAFITLCSLLETESYQNMYGEVCDKFKIYRKDNLILDKVLMGYEKNK